MTTFPPTMTSSAGPKPPAVGLRFRLACLLALGSGLAWLPDLRAQCCGGALQDLKPLIGKPTGGVTKTSPAASAGFFLLAPQMERRTYLLNEKGELLHAWDSAYAPGGDLHLLGDGSLLRSAAVEVNPAFKDASGVGGRLQRIAWDGAIEWDFWYAGTEFQAHHGVEVLPNGNVLMLAWQALLPEQALDLGRSRKLLPKDLIWMDTILELKPKGEKGAEIVWKWRAQDHLVQDAEPLTRNFGKVAEQPGRIDFNHRAFPAQKDWLGLRSLDYDPGSDQILVTSAAFGEVWVIDHGTTTEEAAGSEGGKRGRGGDLLYRWGNPAAHRASSKLSLGAPKDACWVEGGLPGKGNLLILGTGFTLLPQPKDEKPQGRRAEVFLKVFEAPSVRESTGGYPAQPDQWNPSTVTEKTPLWNGQEKLHAAGTGRVQRLPNGNTWLSGHFQGQIAEMTPEGAVVWQFGNPFRGRGLPSAGSSQPAPVESQPATASRPAPIGAVRWYPPDTAAIRERLE